MQEKGKDFEKLLLEAIDEGLKEVLGESGRQMTFFHLERSYLVKRNDIAEKTEDFATGLEKIFGAGASVLEKIIVKNLYSKLGLRYEDKKDCTFADYLNDVKPAKEDVKYQSSILTTTPKKDKSAELNSLQCARQNVAIKALESVLGQTSAK